MIKIHLKSWHLLTNIFLYVLDRNQTHSQIVKGFKYLSFMSMVANLTILTYK